MKYEGYGYVAYDPHDEKYYCGKGYIRTWHEDIFRAKLYLDEKALKTSWVSKADYLEIKKLKITLEDDE